MRKVILKCGLSPGDICTLTAAVHSLHYFYPGEYETDVRTPCPEIWENNPNVTGLSDKEAETFDMHYPLINFSDIYPVPFLQGYTEYLGQQLEIGLRPCVNHPVLYLSEDEKSWINRIEEEFRQPRRFAIVNAGTKKDFTAKQWPIENYQTVINETRHLVQWVQIGSSEHNHQGLSGVIDLRGQTTLRQLIRLAYHCVLGLGPVTLLQHLCAAWQKPYVCLLGGREGTQWTQYPLQHTLHTLGALDCCRDKACWRSRVVRLEDNDEKDNSLCKYPTIGANSVPVAQCMAMIRPKDVIQTIERILPYAYV